MYPSRRHGTPGTLRTRVGVARSGIRIVLCACALLTISTLARANPQWISADDDSGNASVMAPQSSVVGHGAGANRSGGLPGLQSWSGGPSMNLAVCTATGDALYTTAVSDGAGGMIVAWQDGRNAALTENDIYAQHVLKCGVIDPAWPVNGVRLTADPVDDHFPVALSDGAGGAYVAWSTGPVPVPASGNSDILTQHVLSSGVVDPAWPANGLGVCTAPGNQVTPKITTDGAGGAFLTWDDRRTTARHVFVHHLLSTGVDPAWTVNGTRACTFNIGNQSFPAICSDGTGGLVVAWTDARDGTGHRQIFAQRMSSTGALLWAPSGQPVCTATGSSKFLNGADVIPAVWVTSSADGQSNAIIPDGAGGCFLAWTSDQNPASSLQAFAQHVTATGALAAGWAPGGVQLCTSFGPQSAATLLADGAGGIIASWFDESQPGAYAQHVTSSGLVDGPATGLTMSTGGGVITSFAPFGVADGAGGAVFFWGDYRNIGIGNRSDIYAHHVRTSPSFSVDPAWTADGTAVSVLAGDSPLSGDQIFDVGGGQVSDGAGGGIAAWDDNRTLFTTGFDIYAQQILASGGLPADPVATITGPASGSVFPVSTPVTFTGSFTDNPGDTHTAQWMFDAITVPGTVNEGAGTVSATYSFTDPGVYRVKLIVSDQCGSSTATQVGGFDAMVVVYDPFAGFVTGGGWISSPIGAYTADPSAVGNANFGFVSKYLKGSNVPTGETEFELKSASMDFHSSSYDWLVVSGATAQYSGSGTINGAGSYRFTLTALDGDAPTGGGIDKIRMKVTTTSGAVVYDNQSGSPDDAVPTMALGGGSIVIHSPKAGAKPGGTLDPNLDYALSSGQPNPFRAETEIRYSLRERSDVALDLYDLSGRRVIGLVSGTQDGGTYWVRLARQPHAGGDLSGGVYFLRLTAKSVGSDSRFEATRRLVVLN